jgi:YVTN family beta-propeller protein
MLRTRGVVAALALVLAGLVGVAPGRGAAHATPATGRFVALAPTRLLDTRDSAMVPDGGTVVVPIAGRHGAPADLVAAAVTITVTGGVAPGYVTAWPSGEPRPATSNVNTEAVGQTVANTAIVVVGSDGAIALYAARATHVIVDLVGVWEPATTATAGRFVSQRPTRLLDTRADHPLDPAASRVLDLGPATVGADAAIVNLTATNASTPLYVTAWADGSPRPATSNLNVDRAGQTVATLAIVPVHDGRIDLFASASTDLVVDLAGVFTGPSAPQGTDGLFVPTSPTRLLDSREHDPLPRFTGGYRADLQVTGRGGVPASGVAAAVLNLTATQSSLPGYVVAYPAGTQAPTASNVNVDHSWQTVPNLAVVRVGATGAVSLQLQRTGHLVADLFGWFTGPPEPADAGVAAAAPAGPVPSSDGTLRLAGTIGGTITPKSVVATGGGLLFAQNMMYTHTITVYDRTGQLLRTISDRVDMGAFGLPGGSWSGAPVEAAVHPNGKWVYVSNYSMYGPGAGAEGFDACLPGDNVGTSTVYRVDVAGLGVDQVITVGRVPKFLAVSPDGHWLVVSNWCGDDVSIVDTTTAREVARVHVGRNPRGVAITADSRTAYIALMGEGRVAAIDLTTDRVVAESGRIGGGARHLNLSPDGRFLYVTLNEEGSVAKVDVATLTTVARVATGTQPRSAVLSADGRHLYVVNYESASASKVDTTTMRVEQDVRTLTHPIGIAYDSETKQLWVACYVGGILQFSEG